jgi:hypothetical protein
MCHVLGYKPGAVHPQHGGCLEITPYRCEATRDGQRCAEAAVHSHRGKRKRCAAHVGGPRTAKARAGLTANEAAGSVGVEGDGAGKQVRS